MSSHDRVYGQTLKLFFLGFNARITVPKVMLRAISLFNEDNERHVAHVPLHEAIGHLQRG